MKRSATRAVRIDRLALPGDWKARLARLQDSAADLDKTPRLQRPGLRADGKTIIYGRDRIAAAHLHGDKTVECDLWQCTDAEAERAELVENLRRPEDQDALKAALVDWERRQLAPAKVTNCYVSDAPKLGKPVAGEEKGPARAAVAAQLGTTPAAIKQAEYRERKAAREAEEAPAVEETAAMETWGVVVSASALKSAALTQGYIDEMDALLRRVVAAVTKGQETLPETVAQRLELQRVRMELRAVSARLRSLRPEALCVFCKGVSRYQANCQGCGGTGFIGQEAIDRAPKELKRKGAGAGIFVGANDFRVLGQVDDGPEAA